MHVIELCYDSMPPCAAHQIANPIDDALPQVRLQSADRSMLECLDSLQRTKDDVLDDVLGIRIISR